MLKVIPKELIQRNVDDVAVVMEANEVGSAVDREELRRLIRGQQVPVLVSEGVQRGVPTFADLAFEP